MKQMKRRTPKSPGGPHQKPRGGPLTSSQTPEEVLFFTRLPKARHLDIVKLLLEHGADVNQKGYGNHTALSRAICAGRKAVISFLLTVPGVDLNVKETGTGDNLLHLAVNSGLADVYWQIAQAAPHLEDEKNKDGMTPVGTARMDFMKELEKEIKNLKTEEE
ncbi:ankyrin repeat domain-containing protein, putative [Eimeria tenella]|uniref:Ankyrin repeat domain-containing protein, putative n=1 Tax=Eimeria tenella TaxID=5802 RepID=U6L7R7_EIMTE|nr:ankyrin repeat domain-containing protein, putative [Eimeria tenella]CDJ45258.1 ankyrin repeat domain-containing protein, putative [Eimeria tenella]|eukprot:XP_013236005.1 ankyrin repeat domain-containing protein, putative [Eimeria tenella]